MVMVRPNPTLADSKQERLDYQRARLVNLKAAGQLRGAPGWDELRKFIESTREIEFRREKRAVAECDATGGREPWEIVADVRAARRAQQNLDFILDSVDNNEEQVTILTEHVRKLEKELADYREDIKDFGEVAHADE